ncbi:MAG: hypothetical protein HHJ12_05600 [Glaciimonas sp.]|nr:hypothetical protein [Glaciimonas sp.]
MSNKIAKPDDPASALLVRIEAKRAESRQLPFGKRGQSRSGGTISAKESVPT